MTEVAEIFREHSQAYCLAHKLPLRMLKAITAIKQCRTAELGGHIDECDACGSLKISYNSCRNRHCPKCQSLAREKWLSARKSDLLPVQYFHIVFTVPDSINPLAIRNQKEIYEILFKAASATLLELSKDQKHLGAEVGFISLLHTWGQNLMDHPHLHCLVPGGGLSLDGKEWINARRGFFIPVKVMSRLFRGKFLDLLKKIYLEDKLNLDSSLHSFGTKQDFQCLLDKLYQKEWVVFCKPPFQSPEKVLQYLGRYTHRVAISNDRITSFKEGMVSFRWRDYRDGNNKTMTLEAFEFIRRFLLHILPDNFVKIRHYGLLSNRNRKTKLRQCRTILGVDQIADQYEKQKSEESTESQEELDPNLPETGQKICPYCGKGVMVSKELLHPQRAKPTGTKDCLKVA